MVRKQRENSDSTTLHPRNYNTDEYWMRMAFAKAQEAARQGEVPVGAVLVELDNLLAEACNLPITLQDPTGHAEILVLRQVAKLKQNYRLSGTTLYVTLEPCIMCMGALIHARVKRLVYGATDPKTGAVASVYNIGSDNLLNHTIEIEGGVLAEQCGALLKTFFKIRREHKKLDTPY